MYLSSRVVCILLLSVLAVSPLAAQPPGGGNAPPPEVSFVVAEPKSIPVDFTHLGVIEASRTAEVRARIRGFLSERLFDEGARVEEGQVLYRIEKDSFEADVAVAQAQVEQAEARLRLADRELSRIKKLNTTGVVAEGDLDKAQSEYEQSQASLNLAKANLHIAEIQLGYTEIRAPMSGIIDETQKDVGALVDDSNNSLLDTISRISPIYVTFGVSEKDYLQQKNQEKSGEIVLGEGTAPSYELLLQDGSTFSEKGKLNFEATGFDEGTGTRKTRVEFVNREGVLKPGQFVKVKEVGWIRPGTILVPKRSVNQSPMGSAVFVIDQENKLQYRPVTLGSWAGDEWQINSGLKAGERVLVDGIMKARPGSAVTPVPYRSAEAAESGKQVSAASSKPSNSE